MVTLNYSLELDCNERNFFKILTDYENLSNYLPGKLKKIEILEKDENSTTIKTTVFLRSLIKKEFSHKIKIEKKSENNLSVEILDGIAKGTHITISILVQKEKTLCNVNSDIKLSLKTAILYPIIKIEHNPFLKRLFTNMSHNAKQIKDEC
jgi:carbon monoxide dehydrogenase subunit G